MRIQAILLIIWALVLAVPALAGEYAAVTGPCGFRFPQDHGPHPGYRTEWWYYTGNLETDAGRRFGFQLTFFRSRIAPPSAEADWPDQPSSWRTAQIYLAHAALSDLSEKRFFHAEQTARGVVGLAGAAQKGDQVGIFLHNWSAVITPAGHRLFADTDDFSLDISLVSQKPPVPHGQGGYSQKGKQAKSASCYYSLTRLKAGGAIELDGRRWEVGGLAWMDHEYSSAPLESDLAGWDWFSLQFENGTELMAYFLRQEDGGFGPASSATFVDKAGKARHIPAEALRLTVTDTWKSPHTQAVYPAGWQLEVAPLSMTLDIRANMADQEMRTPGSTGVSYWEGSVSVKGTKRENKRIQGTGYVELTGYERPFDAPM